mgnify:CR=1 FL=1
MILDSMTKGEFSFWMPRCQKAYAQDKMRANQYSEEEAKAIAAEDLARLLPKALETENHYFFSAKNEAGTILGYAWLWIRGAESRREAFVCDVIIEPEFRGYGHGRKLMELIEAEAQKRGATRIGLHVFGFNSRAINLYSSLGFETTDLVMEKPI